MKKLLIFVIFLIYFPVFSIAGEIYGNIKFENSPVGKGIPVEIKSSGGKVYNALTDEFGSYRIYINETGECKLKITYEGQSPAITVYSNKNSVRYNLILIKRNERYYLTRQ